MKNYETIVGIDVSKLTFDATILQVGKPGQGEHSVFRQTPEGLGAFHQWLSARSSDAQTVLICMEHTGMYIHGLLEMLSSTAYTVWVEMPLRMKRCLGLQRGGDDKLASKLIAQYAMRYRDQVQPWRYEDAFIQELRQLTAQRLRLLDTMKKLTVPVNELRQSGQQSLAAEMEQYQAEVISSLERGISKVEQRIDELVNSNEQASKAIRHVCSLKGVSTRTAVSLYVYTKGFRAFSEAGQLACYCGVVPFEKRSGTSVRYKPGVSPYANKELKRLLHLCAMSAIRHDKDLSAYYKRKTAEGKNKMSVLNAVRNKLVRRIFAVVRDGRDYVQCYDRQSA